MAWRSSRLRAAGTGAQQYRRIKPEALQLQLDAAVETLWRLADRPGTVNIGALLAADGVATP